MNPQQTFEIISLELKRNANLEKSVSMKKYMKEQGEFLGISSPVRKEITKEWMKVRWETESENFDFFHLLWNAPHREFHYLGMEWAHKQKLWKSEKFLSILEHCIHSRPWWDTLDFIAANWAGGYFSTFPEKREEVLSTWISHSHFWFNRVAILHQLTYKSKTDESWLERSMLPHIQQKEFFIRKSIGWALRQYARTSPDWVKAFVEKHPLSNLSKREALKHL